MVGDEFTKKMLGNNIGRYVRAIESEEYAPKHSHYRTRIRNAVSGTELGGRIENCSRVTRKQGDKVCGSIFCEMCQRRRQDYLYKTYRDYAKKAFGNEQEARDRLRWVTALDSIVAVNTYGADADQSSLNSVVSAVEGMRGKIGRIARRAKDRFDAEIWLRGAIHLELIDLDLFHGAGVSGPLTPKEQTLKELLEESKFSGWGGKAILVHFHALADTTGMPDSDFSQLFSDEWDAATRQVLIQRTWEFINDQKQSLDDGLRGMSRYCYNWSNERLKFKRNWRFDSDTKTDEKDNAITYAREILDLDVNDNLQLSIGDLRFLIAAHQEVSGDSGKGLLVSIY